MTEVQRLAKEIREQNKLYEKGRADEAFWLGQKVRLGKMKEADKSLTQAQMGELVGKDGDWVGTVLRSDPARGVLPKWYSGSNKRDEVVGKALEDPDRRSSAFSELPTRTLQELADEADEVVAERREAKRSEQASGVTGKHVADFKPDEFWMDNVIIRLNRNAREAMHLYRQGGGLLGGMETQMAFEYLQEAEQLIAEIRVAFQERVRDEVPV